MDNEKYEILTSTSYKKLADIVDEWLISEPGWQPAGRPFTDEGYWYQAVWTRN